MSISRTFSSVGDHLGLVLEAVARADLADPDLLDGRAHGRWSLGSGVMGAPVVVLAGGTGGAKLARGLQDEVGEDLVVVANTGDDGEFHGGHVSPDPDLVTFWLADRIDERGWGLEGDTFAVMDGLRELGEEVWFNLGDRDLALCLRRARRLREGARLTEAIDEARRAYGVAARVLPMSDDPVRTHVKADGRWWPFQEFMIRHGAAGPVEGVELRGAAEARPRPRCWRRSPPRARSSSAPRTRSSRSGRSSPSPACARRCSPRPRRSWRCHRSSAARCSRARPTRSWPTPGSR